MSAPSASCILCGVPIRGLPNRPWISEWRAIYTTDEDWDAARISGIGRVHQSDHVVPLDNSINIDVSESVIDGDWAKIELMKLSFGDGRLPQDPSLMSIKLWGYPLHTRCWDILCVHRDDFEDTAVVQALLDLCRSQPIQFGLMDWGDNYDGLWNYIRGIEELLPGEEMRMRQRFIMESPFDCDPCDIPQMRPGAFRSVEDDIKEHVVAGLRMASSINKHDPFRALPPELRVQILLQQKSSDVANLRLASRAFSDIQLPEIFWRSRFWPDKELAHIFHLVQSPGLNGQWKATFKKAKALQNLPAIINRKRIWSRASLLSSLISARLRCQLSGAFLSQEESEPRVLESDSHWCRAKGSVFPASLDFWCGSRALFERTLVPSSSVVGISVSSIRLHDKTYISGFRMTPWDGRAMLLGYYNPGQSTTVTWDGVAPHSDMIVGFEAALDSRGIRGLCFSSSDGLYSSWVGDHDGLLKQSVSATSLRGFGDVIIALKGGFDALKLVSLSLQRYRVQGRHRIQALSSGLWYPNIPDSQLCLDGFSFRRLSLNLHSLPFSMCLFGGQDAQLLPRLTRLTIWTFVQPVVLSRLYRTHIWGIGFHFEGPTNTMLLGHIPQPRQGRVLSYDLTLDSSNGERLVAVKNIYQDSTTLSGISIRTNRGRSVQVPSNYREGFDEERSFSRNLCPEGCDIVGFYTVFVGKTRSDVFQVTRERDARFGSCLHSTEGRKSTLFGTWIQTNEGLALFEIAKHPELTFGRWGELCRGGSGSLDYDWNPQVIPSAVLEHERNEVFTLGENLNRFERSLSRAFAWIHHYQAVHGALPDRPPGADHDMDGGGNEDGENAGTSAQYWFHEGATSASKKWCLNRGTSSNMF
ncbi:hypothetical protein NM208_g12576 [Fusarium decemcellulare]|uniref:Uncharacterized protein n=1 Tax=Fusarium decemcellulare TaxID=57161 RepID=A0ACC1RN31_9HYPO|nr:hypothetical protein NM208_g12576 [Fusarium decemcellulare]